MTRTPTATSPDTAPHIDSWAALRAWRIAIHTAGLKPRTILLGLLIADHVNGTTWQAWPSQATLAALSGDGAFTRQVRERLTELLSAGWLLVAEPGRPRQAARYVLTLPTGSETLRIGSDSLRLETLHPDRSESLHPDRSESLRGSPRKSERTVRGTSKAGADPARPDGRPVTPTGPTTSKSDDAAERIARRLALYDRLEGKA